ncbi:MAG: sel1 repeat family protein [Proteobacteria bacterium]|nr:sel1 repeat family protein [Pseudomonadota bacterium]
MADPRPVSARDRRNLEFAQAAEAAEARGDFDAALALWRRAGSFVNVGYAYDTGLGRPVDKAKAMAWYRRGYRRGCAPCANNIAILYREQGRPELADRWFRREAALTPAPDISRSPRRGWIRAGRRRATGLAWRSWTPSKVMMCQRTATRT